MIELIYWLLQKTWQNNHSDLTRGMVILLFYLQTKFTFLNIIWFLKLPIEFRKNIKFYNICLILANKCYILLNIGNENKQMWFASNKEVRLMVDTGCLIAIIYILFYSLIGITIIALTSIIALVILLCKSK